MSQSNKKQFGVWMDSQNATIIGKQNPESETFEVLSQVKNNGTDKNSNENAANNQEIASTQKYFKEIAQTMPNVNEIHVTGTGQIQKQFIKFLADTPQYKNATASESTANKMSNEESITFFTKYFN